MAKYRKKPIVIEAVRWDGNKISEVTEWTKEALAKSPSQIGSFFRMGHSVSIHTLEGTMMASPGDYIIRGVNGELYPCKPDIFEKSYEPAE